MAIYHVHNTSRIYRHKSYACYNCSKMKHYTYGRKKWVFSPILDPESKCETSLINTHAGNTKNRLIILYNIREREELLYFTVVGLDQSLFY